MFDWLDNISSLIWACYSLALDLSFNILNFIFSAPTLIHGARISGLEARMDQVEDRICDLDARGLEEADNLANDRDLDRVILS